MFKVVRNGRLRRGTSIKVSSCPGTILSRRARDCC